ncbi:hypothetical protein K2Y11_12210 [bacterium]|nr:hypothetical protein [bacterium]
MSGDDSQDIVLGQQTDWDDITQRLIGMYDQPAYMRRALRVEDALRGLEQRLAKQRDQQLEPVRRHLRLWLSLVEKLPATPLNLNEGQRHTLDDIMREVLKVRRPLAGQLWLPRWNKILAEIERSVNKFNERWDQFLAIVDLSPVNQRIDEYNANYLLEKECAFRSARAAARGYQPLSHVSRDWLRQLFPPLPSFDRR